MKRKIEGIEVIKKWLRKRRVGLFFGVCAGLDTNVQCMNFAPFSFLADANYDPISFLISRGYTVFETHQILSQNAKEFMKVSLDSSFKSCKCAI